MFGKITEINGSSCVVENKSHLTHSELMNCHVVFPESDRLVVREITKLYRKPCGKIPEQQRT